jgi:ABC-2 type transport system ATP-binding protein
MEYKRLIELMIRDGISDILFKPGSCPLIRVNGQLVQTNIDPLSAQQTEEICKSLLTPEQFKQFSTRNEIDIACTIDGVSRFRANVYRQKGTIAVALRTIPLKLKTFEELHLPNQTLKKLVGQGRGLILFAGVTGAGKTTTLEIIEGLKLPSQGSVTVLGLNAEVDAPEIRKRIGVQLQSSSYLKFLNLSELIKLFGSLYGKKVDPQKLLGFVNLEDKAKDEVQNLSGGQKQRFTLATALANDPEILFLDEPTTGLDPRARRDVWKLVKEINSRGMTVILTTHYMEEAEYLCNRVAIMDHGKILEIDDPKQLIDRLSHTTQVSFFTDKPVDGSWWKEVADVERVYGNYPKVILEIKSLDYISEILKVLREHSIAFTGFTVKTATLEDVYLDLTGKEFE